MFDLGGPRLRISLRSAQARRVQRERWRALLWRTSPTPTRRRRGALAYLCARVCACVCACVCARARVHARVCVYACGVVPVFVRVLRCVLCGRARASVPRAAALRHIGLPSGHEHPTVTSPLRSPSPASYTTHGGKDQVAVVWPEADLPRGRSSASERPSHIGRATVGTLARALWKRHGVCKTQKWQRELRHGAAIEQAKAATEQSADMGDTGRSC